MADKKVELNAENLDGVAGGFHMPSEDMQKTFDKVLNPDTVPDEKLSDKFIIAVNQKQVKSSKKNCNEVKTSPYVKT